MAYKSIYTYNKPLEEMRKRIEQRTYEIQQERKRQMEEARSMRTIFDVFLNKKGREKYDNGNWFETTFKSFGEFFDRNYTEWFRNPANALLNNLSSIGDTLDYAANLIKAPLIASVKGEDVGQRLADAYGVGDNGRIAQNMSDLREALGANNPGAEIGASTGFGALAGAEIGSKAGLPGLAIGSLIGAALGAINSGIDVGVRESGTDNAFLKGTQTVANTITDMIMEYGVDPANFFGMVGDISKNVNVAKNIKPKEAIKIDDIAKQDISTTASFKKSLKGEKAYKVNEILDHTYKSAAESCPETIVKKNGKVIKYTEAQRHKQFEKKVKKVFDSYMGGDEKSFNKYFIETGIGKYLSDDPDILNKQLKDIYKTLRHDANMSKVGRLASFIDKFDQGFAKKLYKFSVPGLTLMSAKKAFVSASKAWNNSLIEVARRYEAGDTNKPLTGIKGVIYDLAEKRYYNDFKKAGIIYEVGENATLEEISKAYRSMSDNIKIYSAQKKFREAQVLRSLRKRLTLSKGGKNINLGDAEKDLKILTLFHAKDSTITLADKDTALEHLTDLFYFEDGIDYFQDLLFTPAKSDMLVVDSKLMENIAEDVITFMQDTIKNDPTYIYVNTLEDIAKKTFKWDALNTSVEEFYNNEIHNRLIAIIEAMKNGYINKKQQQQFISDINQLLNRGYIDSETVERIANYYDPIMFFDTKSNLSSYAHPDGNLTNFSPSSYIKIIQNDGNYISPSDYLRKREIELKQLYQTSPEEFKQILIKYSNDKRLVEEGKQIRSSFNKFKKATANPISVDTTVRNADIASMQELRKKYIVDTFIEAFKNKTGVDMSKDLTLKLSKELEEQIDIIYKELDKSNISSYDVLLHFNNMLSAGNTKLFNAIKYQQIKDTDMFLAKFTNDIKKSREIYNDINIKPRRIKKGLSSLSILINQNHTFMAINNIVNTDDRRAINKAIVSYIFKGSELSDSTIGLLHKHLSRKSSFNKFVTEIESIRDAITNIEDIQYMYNKLILAFDNSLSSGNSLEKSLQSVSDALDFALEKNMEHLYDGSFIDSLIQSRIYETTLSEIVKDLVDDSYNGLYKKVFKELNTTANIKDTIEEAFLELYSKRYQLTKKLAELEEQKSKVSPRLEKQKIQLHSKIKDIKKSIHDVKVQKEYYEGIKQKYLRRYMDGDHIKEIYDEIPEDISRNINKYNKQYKELQTQLESLQKQYDELSDVVTIKKIELQQKIAIDKFRVETDNLYNNLNSITALLFATNLDDATYSLKKNKEFSNLVNNISKIKGKSIPSSVRKTYFEMLTQKINDAFLNSFGFKNSRKFVEDILALSSDPSLKMFTENGKLVFKNVKDEIIYSISSIQLKKFLDNLSALHKQNWIRTETFKNIGLPKSSLAKRLRYMKDNTNLLKRFYVNNFRPLVKGDTAELNINKFYGIMRNYKKDLDKIEDKIAKNIDDAEIINKNHIIYNKIKKTEFAKHYTSANTNENALANQIKTSRADLFNEPFISNVSIVDGEPVIQKISLNDLCNKDNNQNTINALNRMIIDTETTIENDNVDKKLLQLTLRSDEDNAINILIYRPDMTNEYRLGNEELLNADYINGNFVNIGGKPLENTENYIKYSADGNEYMLFKTEKAAAQYMLDTFKAQGILSDDGILIYAGHNASGFDSEIILRFINSQIPNSIKSVNVTDTLYLARALKAATELYDDKDNTLSSLYKLWINAEDEVINGAHNAANDTLMNLKLLNYIKNRIGDKPNEFFAKNFKLRGSEFINDNRKAFNEIELLFKDDPELFDNVYNAIKSTTLDDMIDKVQHIKEIAKELRTSVNDEYIKSIYDNMNEYFDGLVEYSKNIKSIEDLEHFIHQYDSFINSYGDYLNFELNSDRLWDIYDSIVEKYQNRMTAIYGDSRVIGRLNREQATDIILDNFSMAMNDSYGNAFQDIFYLLTATPEDIDKSIPATLVGDVLKNVLKQYDYNKELLYIDFPEIKQFIGYSNRINSFINFRQEMYDILDSYADSENYEKIRNAYSALMTSLFGFGTGDRASIDNRLTSFIKVASLEDLNNTPALKGKLMGFITDDVFNMFDEHGPLSCFNKNDQDKIATLMFNYIYDCLENIDDYSLAVNRTSRSLPGTFTILKPTPDRYYINTAIHAFSTQSESGLLNRYQSIINPIIAEKTVDALSEQDYDKNGFDVVIKNLRDSLAIIKQRDLDLSFSPLPTAFIEEKNGKTIWQINNSMNEITFKSANNYTREWNEINDSKNAIYKAFKIDYDLVNAEASTFRNVESKFHTLVRDMQETLGLSNFQMQQIADIAALDDPVYDIEKQIFIDYFDTYLKEDNNMYKTFKESIMKYKQKDLKEIEDIAKRTEEIKKLENSIKVYYAAAVMYGLDDFGEVKIYKTDMGGYKLASKLDNMISHTIRHAEESKEAFNELFKDELGNVNYALMHKYIQSNPYMRVVAMIPSDRYNNMEKSQYRLSNEFVVTSAKSPEELAQLMQHDPSKDGIRYFVTDKHNIMILKKMIGQTTGNKTYTNRKMFANHPGLEKLMKFRDVVAKYMLMPTKVLGLHNLGFTITNTIEGFLKTMTAADGNRIDTVKKYHKAIRMHRDWVRATNEIATAIQGSPFYREKNQWIALLKEYDNSKALFKDANIIDIKRYINENNFTELKKLMPTLQEFKDIISKSENLANYNKAELIRKYSKLLNKTNTEQNERILALANRYVRVMEAYDGIINTYNKDEFDFITDFVNSPAAAAEMQSIKKANELNLIGNKTRISKDGKVQKVDNPIDRFYKKVLFSDWGLGNNPFRVITPYYNLSLNSDIETINRLALHMDLLDKGYSYSESYNRVLQTHFNYGDKSEPELLAELIFPFISFPFRTALFWDDMMDEHPELIKIFADLVLTNWGKDAQNQYNQTGITKGGLKITPWLSMESGSSFLDSLMFAGNTLDVLKNRKLNPLLGPLVEGAKQLTTGQSNWDYRFSRLPLISKVMYGVNLADSLSKSKTQLYDIAPSVFNKVYEENRYYYNNQEHYKYRSIYNRLYTATGKNRWNTTSVRSRVSAIRNLNK